VRAANRLLMQGKIFSRMIIPLKQKKGPYLLSNDPKRSIDLLSEVNLEVRNPTYQTKDIQSKSLLKHGVNFDSDNSKFDFNTPYQSQQGNLTPKPENTSQRQIFITFSKITQQERIKIIQRGFQFQAQGAISLKKYYESTDPNSFYQWKGYSIKYESIRRTKLYQQCKL